ncbi:unnamed protein product [Paramecium octaurelia]|uniref:Uncharacterized protein n=1 Tax=Paramecium octaurelia TaxID=43137 RepID=A0A8S1XHK7_PAROT|nr:unnamed protein product [Paramecium octaurelia]
MFLRYDHQRSGSEIGFKQTHHGIGCTIHLISKSKHFPCIFTYQCIINNWLNCLHIKPLIHIVFHYHRSIIAVFGHLFILFEGLEILSCQWCQFFKRHIIILFLN